MNRIWLLSAIVFLQSACGTFQESSISVIEYPPALETAHRFYREKNLPRAEAEVDRYLSTTTEVYYHGYAYLLLGEIRETGGQEARAVDAYKQVMSHAAGYHSTALAQALYRLSWIYERENKYEDMLVTLLDLQRNLRAGDNFIKLVETPARLANLYYVLGQWEKALAERNKLTPEIMTKYKHLAKNENNIFQAQFYRAFQVLKPTLGVPKQSNDVVAMTQKELLEIGEMGPQKMAEKAFKAIEDGYTYEFSLLKKPIVAKNPVESDVASRRRLDEWAKYIDMIEDLKAERRPAELAVNSSQSLQFFARMEGLESESKRRIQQLEFGMRPSNKGKNPSELPPPPPKKPPPPRNRVN